jgi:hypothetical protein
MPILAGPVPGFGRCGTSYASPGTAVLAEESMTGRNEHNGPARSGVAPCDRLCSSWFGAECIVQQRVKLSRPYDLGSD